MKRSLVVRGCLSVFMAGLVGVGVGRSSAADNWPQYRGPSGDGVAANAVLPAIWRDNKNVAWKIELPGPGGSSPIVWGKQVFVTCYTGYGTSAEKPGDQKDLVRHVLCLDRATGKQLWKYDAPAALPEEEYSGFITEHGYASSTPCTDGQMVYAQFGKSGLYALSLDGKQQWHADLGAKTHPFGSGASPLLYKDLVIVNAAVESNSLIAFDKKTGDERWRVGDIREAWDSPVLVEVDGHQELVLIQEGPVLGLDPQTGKQLWTCQGFDDYVCANVVAHDGVVYAMGDRTARQSLAIRAGGTGDVTKTNLLWRANKAGNVSSAVYHDGYLYFLHDNMGIAYCLNAKNGEVVYEERLEPRSGKIYAPAVLADGKIYAFSRSNGCYVIAAQPKFELLSNNEFTSDVSVVNAAPAISDGQLLLRSDAFLYCIGKK